MRNVLLLAAVLPMLMPPGVCVCRLVPGGKDARPNPATPQSVAPRPPAADASPARDCCCSGKRARGSTAHPHPAPAVGQPRDDRAGHSHPCPAPVRHLPGCPAATDDSRLSAVVPTSAFAPPPADACRVAGAVEVPTARPESGDSSPHAPSDRPLFLSHRALLI